MTASTATDDPNTMTGNLYSDRNLLDKYFVQPMQYSYEYSGRSEQVANRARQNAASMGNGERSTSRGRAARSITFTLAAPSPPLPTGKCAITI